MSFTFPDKPPSLKESMMCRQVVKVSGRRSQHELKITSLNAVNDWLLSELLPRNSSRHIQLRLNGWSKNFRGNAGRCVLSGGESALLAKIRPHAES